jgi:putative transposase
MLQFRGDARCGRARHRRLRINVACLVAVGVNADGRREILGLDVVPEEDGRLGGPNGFLV